MQDLKGRCPLVLLVGYLTLTEAHEQIKCAILPDVIPWDVMEELWFSCVTHTDPYGSELPDQCESGGQLHTPSWNLQLLP